MSDLLDLPSWKLGTGDLIQQIALYLWLNKGNDYKDIYETITHARIVYELYNRISGESETEKLQALCIGAIVAYVKKHPKATEADLAKELTKQIEIFKGNINSNYST